jgi:sugar lactone lactonase YvrE
MDNEEKDFTRGSLYRLNPDRSLVKIRGQVGISNGLGWSPSNTLMYYADSPAKVIYCYDYDLATGEATDERVFTEIDLGVPDGLTVDSAGFVWNAQWDAWRVVRYAPDGSVDRIVRLPVQRPTSCMFGGPDLDELFITSASINLTPAQRQQQPDAGNVLVVKTDIAGLPEPRFAG